jgi:hypothetical protein
MLDIVKGSDPRIAITLQTSDRGMFSPYDITTKTISVKYKDSTNVLVTKNTAPSIEIIDAVYGKLSLNLTDTDTEALKIGKLNLDVYVEEAGETLIWKLVGQINVIDRIR